MKMKKPLEERLLQIGTCTVNQDGVWMLSCIFNRHAGFSGAGYIPFEVKAGVYPAMIDSGSFLQTGGRNTYVKLTGIVKEAGVINYMDLAVIEELDTKDSRFIGEHMELLAEINPESESIAFNGDFIRRYEFSEMFGRDIFFGIIKQP